MAGSKVYPRMPLQLVEVSDTISIDNDNTDWDVDLTEVEFNGFLMLKTETLTRVDLTALIVSVTPIVRNAAGTWVVPESATAIALDSVDVDGVGEMGAWDISRAFEDNGDAYDFFSLEGLRFNFADAGEGTIVAKVMVR